MRGFLARAGHILGRLTVSRGYGEPQSVYDQALVVVTCMATRPCVFTTEVVVDEIACMSTEVIGAAVVAAPVADAELRTTPTIYPVEVTTGPFDPHLETEPDAC